MQDITEAQTSWGPFVMFRSEGNRIRRIIVIQDDDITCSGMAELMDMNEQHFPMFSDSHKSKKGNGRRAD